MAKVKKAVDAAVDASRSVKSANLLAGLGGAAVLGASVEDAEAGELRDKFYSAIEQAKATDDEMAAEFPANDFRYGETKRGEDSPNGSPRIYINRRKLEDAGAGEGYMETMLVGEGLHLLKDIDPERHQRILEAALSEPEVMEWARESYAREGDERAFEDWFVNSRLDQVIGGYLLGGKDSNIPTMREWDKTALPYGTKFRAELDLLGEELGITPPRGPVREANEGAADGYNSPEFKASYNLPEGSGFADPMSLAITAAITGAATEFYRRRESKQSFWQQRREELSELINAGDEFIRPAMPYINSALEALDKPMQGYYGVASALGALVEGNGLDASLQRGATVARQPIEETAQEYGGVLADEGYPLAGTALNTAMQVTGPF